uniref:cyclin-SDS n=1 Tax=Erigeron canadensis TaxID=72917 RepID=UPI001CB90845|nr:cyclin-SDS [Erigeron canadensis]
MKKLRSNLPRRKRSNYSPILKSSPVQKPDSISILTREVDFSCDTSSRVSRNSIKSSAKKRRFVDGENDEFRRITRSYSKRLAENKKKDVVEVSESSSCVDFVNSSLIRKGFDDLNGENDVVSVTFTGIKNSEVTTRSECSIFPKELRNEENDVVSASVSVSVCSRVVSPLVKFETTVNEGQSAYSEAKDDYVSVSSQPKFGTTSYCYNLSNAATVNEGQSFVYSLESAPKSGILSSYNNNKSNNKSEANETVNDDETETENCGESKLIAVDLDLTCSEQLSDNDDDDERTISDMYISANEYSSDFVSSTWYESGSQFSERSFGDTTPSPMFQLFLDYCQKFYKSDFSTKVISKLNDNECPVRISQLLRPEDEEHEESYWMMKERERRQLYVHDYSVEYCEMKEYGDLVVQQRLQMVHWIMEQSNNKELQTETMFLGVNLWDRFLSKGYFRKRRELEIAGIACLTLATRIEENQPFNSIRQKLFHVGSNNYSRSEVVAMEWLVQEALNFQCFLPTIYNFLWFYLQAARANENVDKNANYLAKLALLGHQHLCYWPSTVAASLVILACLADNPQASQQQVERIHEGSNDKDVHDCTKALEWMVTYIC